MCGVGSSAPDPVIFLQCLSFPRMFSFQKRGIQLLSRKQVCYHLPSAHFNLHIYNLISVFTAGFIADLIKLFTCIPGECYANLAIFMPCRIPSLLNKCSLFMCLPLLQDPCDINHAHRMMHEICESCRNFAAYVSPMEGRFCLLSSVILCSVFLLIHSGEINWQSILFVGFLFVCFLSKCFKTPPQHAVTRFSNWHFLRISHRTCLCIKMYPVWVHMGWFRDKTSEKSENTVIQCYNLNR